MSLSPEAIAEFQNLYSKEYGVVLTVEEAQIKAGMLIELFKIMRDTPAIIRAAPATGEIQNAVVGDDSVSLAAPHTPSLAPSSLNPSFESPLSKSLHH